MALVTGSAVGTGVTQEDLYIEGAPTLTIQDWNASVWKNPDANGFYWGITGTSTYNYYEIGCVTDVSLTENLAMSDVLCDNVGVKDTIQQRNYFEFVLTVQSFFPVSVSRHIIKAGATTKAAPLEYIPLGKINNAQFYHVYAPTVYDTDAGDLIIYYFHKCKFVDAWTTNMKFGDRWNLTGIKLRAFVDSNFPAAQQFGCIVRSDISAVV